MTRLVPKSLAGRMIALLLLALVASQAVSLFVLLGEQRLAVRAADRQQVLSRTVSIVRLLGETPVELSGRIIETASGPRLGFWLDARSAVDPTVPAHRRNPVSARLASLLEGTGVREVLVRIETPDDDTFFVWRDRPMHWMRYHGDDDENGADDDYMQRHQRMRMHMPWAGNRRQPPLSLTLAVLLPDGRWLNAATLLPTTAPAWAWTSLVSMAAMAIAITLIVVLSVRRITRPMRALAAAADGLGRGEEVAPLPEDGPEDVRRTTHAFNEMGARLQRFVRDRTRMLAAISHDLRTPITSLRLRAEFVEDGETRRKILETLDEMQAMTEAALAFVREDAAREDTRRVDLAALIESLCDDLRDGGMEVTFAGADKTPIPCRPVALKRAIRNLIENAVAYGERARIALRQSAAELEITVDDDGPGIPEADLDRVFEPFLRLETSRSRETGGVGLGLAIARSIARSHGGDIELSNRPEGGLRATLRLPKARGV